MNSKTNIHIFFPWRFYPVVILPCRASSLDREMERVLITTVLLIMISSEKWPYTQPMSQPPKFLRWWFQRSHGVCNQKIIFVFIRFLFNFSTTIEDIYATLTESEYIKYKVSRWYLCKSLYKKCCKTRQMFHFRTFGGFPAIISKVFLKVFVSRFRKPPNFIFDRYTEVISNLFIAT